MWVLKKTSAPRVKSRRFVSLLTATLVVAVFATIGPLANTALAEDAIWEGEVLKYNDEEYSKTTAPPDLAGKPNEYQFVKGIAHFFVHGNVQ